MRSKTEELERGRQIIGWLCAAGPANGLLPPGKQTQQEARGPPARRLLAAAREMPPCWRSNNTKKDIIVKKRCLVSKGAFDLYCGREGKWRQRETPPLQHGCPSTASGAGITDGLMSLLVSGCLGSLLPFFFFLHFLICLLLVYRSDLLPRSAHFPARSRQTLLFFSSSVMFPPLKHFFSQAPRGRCSTPAFSLGDADPHLRTSGLVCCGQISQFVPPVCPPLLFWLTVASSISLLCCYGDGCRADSVSSGLPHIKANQIQGFLRLFFKCHLELALAIGIGKNQN